MFAILCRRGLRVPLNDCDFVVPRQNAVLVKSFSSSVCKNDSEKSFTVSYLINSCGLSSNDAISVSKKLCFKSREKPDAVLELLMKYGFTNASIPRLVFKWPRVLLACPNKNLLPKLEFFRSIGIPLPVLARKLSVYPYVLWRSLENTIIPYYNDLRSLLQSDERVVHVFTRGLKVFDRCWAEGVSLKISMLRERGVPESSIVSLVVCQPALLIIPREKLAAYVDRAIGLGFDTSRSAFIDAIRVFVDLTESTLKQKMEVYRRCGWTEADIIAAFLRYPKCMNISERKIMDNMDFLVNALGCKHLDVVKRPMLLGLSLEERIKPRSLVARILDQRGLLKNTSGVVTLLSLSEERFLKRYIRKYENDIPELSNIYLSRRDM